jgi:hypothetical protein
MLGIRKRDAGHRSVRHGGATAILLALPLLTVLGSLAPVVVTVQYEEEEQLVPSKREPYRVVRQAHRALLAAQHYTMRWIPEIVDLEKLFAPTRYRARPVYRRAELPQFPRSRGDMIVLSELDSYTGDAFEGKLQPGVVADATAVWDPRLFDVIPDTTRPGNTDQFDDFTGPDESEEDPPVVVPEPGTGSLVALGLIALALRARQRQPATS